MNRNNFERALRASKIGDVFVTSDRSWPRFDAIARKLELAFKDSVELHGNTITHTLTRIK